LKLYKYYSCPIGLASEKNAFNIYYGERAHWSLLIEAKGPTGHGRCDNNNNNNSNNNNNNL